MNIAIMQPYIFPYIGYFQLIDAVDVFVFYDDVNFINRGWINRNRILVNGKDQLFTISCKDASQNKLIKDVELLNDPKATDKLLATIRMAYRKAPYFNNVYPLIEQTLHEPCNNIADLAAHSIINICNYLGLKKTFKFSGVTYNNRELKKADRLIDICHIEGISNYINPSGGQEIYTKEFFASNGVDLKFIMPEKVEYTQFTDEFVPWLSIIDVLMFNPADKVNELLTNYQLA